MIRPFLIVATVAGLSCCLAHLEQAQGERTHSSTWVRTIDGWEPSGVLNVEPRPAATPALHPAIVASFQLGASFFALLAFPSRKPNRSPKPHSSVRSHRSVTSRRKRQQAQLGS